MTALKMKSVVDCDFWAWRAGDPQKGEDVTESTHKKSRHLTVISNCNFSVYSA